MHLITHLHYKVVETEIKAKVRKTEDCHSESAHALMSINLRMTMRVSQGPRRMYYYQELN